ncbi:MAG: ATP-binding cassette domain-containing protein [Candidatus Aegiribacteria sp.]|nr:ATP-binding cassette domain-containing protein [Candidatus Aegiribacteria sp.]
MPPYISIGGYSDPPRIPYLSIEADCGELVALVGGPGSGKSNLIKSIAGIRSAGRDSIRIMGARPGSMRAREESVFVFQNSNFSPDLTVRNQLERRIALLRRVPTSAVQRDVAGWCEEMELTEAADNIPGKTNRSQLQMLSLAPLALTSPFVVVLDEPVANLSSLMVSSALAIIISLLEKASVLVLAQNKSPLVKRADRVVNLP